MKPIILCIFLLISSLSHSVRFEEAAVNYKNKDYKIAYPQFLELAELGNKDAQYALGLMYLNGEGLKASAYDAYAWIALSASKGNEDHNLVLDSFHANLTKEQLAQAKAKLAEISERYGDEAVEKRLMPVFTNKENLNTFHHMRPLRKKSPEYPKKALNRYLSGQVLMEFIVSADGRVKYPAITLTTDKLFDKAAIEAAKAFLYRPAKIGNLNVDTFSVSNRFTFELKGQEINDKKIKSYLSKKKAEATTGSSIDRYTYAMQSNILVRYLPEKAQAEFSGSHEWMKSAAIDGLPHAKYQMGKFILYGEQCLTDPDKSYFWLTDSADDGFSPAQLILGIERFKGARYSKNEKEGIEWLSRAAKNTDTGKLELALALVTAEDKSLRDLNKAQRLIEEINTKEFIDKVSYYEISAVVFTLSNEQKQKTRALKLLEKQAKKYNLPYDILLKNVENHALGQPIEVLLKG